MALEKNRYASGLITESLRSFRHIYIYIYIVKL